MTSRLPGPVLIGGDGRSGTTLVSVVLDSHPQLAVGPELHFRGPKNLGRYVLDLLEVRLAVPDDEQWMALRHDPELYAGVHFINRCHRFGVDAECLRELVRQVLAAGAGTLEDFADRCRLIDAVGEHVRAASGARRWGIKIMREITVADWYVQAWPDAVFVHVVRDGRDVAASQIEEHPGWGYADVQAAAAGWARIIDKVDALAGRLPVVQLRYEDLVADPRTALAPVLEHLDVTWDDQLLRHERLPHALFDNPYGHPSIGTVTRPINPAAVQRYQQDLTVEQVAAFESVAADQLQRHDYAVVGRPGVGAGP